MERTLEVRKIIQKSKKLLMVIPFMVAPFAALTLPEKPYETDPSNVILDEVVWPFYQGILMNACGAGDKKSTTWQWNSWDVDQRLRGQIVAGDPDVFVRQDTRDKVQMSCGGWHKTVEVKPKDEAEVGVYFRKWRLMYRGISNRNMGQELLYNLLGPVRLMRGNGDYVVYGIDLLGKELELKVEDSSTRNENNSVPVM